MSETQATNNIPDANDVKTPRMTAWRVASGKILRGSDKDGSLEEKDKLVGALRRVGIHFGVKKDGSAFGQVEADIETTKGMERVKVDLTDLDGHEKGSSASKSFLWGLLQIGKDENCMLTAAQSKEPNKYGKHATYANWFTLKQNAQGGWDTVMVPKQPRTEEDLDDAVMRLRGELKGHPAYAERAAQESDDDHGNATTHLSALCKEMAEKGWPTPEQNPAGWLKMMGTYFKLPQPKAGLREHDDDEWGEIRQQLQNMDKCPTSIQMEARGALV